MSLSLGQLKEVANNVMKQQRLLDNLVSEARDTFGPTISTRTNLDQVCGEILDRSDLLEARGSQYTSHFRTSTLKKLLETNNRLARFVAARFLPEGLIQDLAYDRDPDVRYEACRRLPEGVLKEVADFYPADFGVKLLIEKKKPAHDDEHLHMYDKKRMGKAARPETQPEFSDLFYETLAKKAVQDYGTNIEGQWEEIYAQRYCSSYKMTNGVELDCDKLYKAIMKELKEKDDHALSHAELKHLEKLHRMRESVEYVQTAEDSLEDLMAENLTPSEYINKVNEAFKVRASSIPAGLRKHTISAGNLNLPMKATVPGGSITYIAEQALDRYVSKWNSTLQLMGENMKLSWSPDPTSSGKVCFHVVIK